MHGKVPALRRTQAQRHRKPIAYITRTRGHCWYVHSQHQMPVARLRRTVRQRQRSLGAAGYIQLKPGMARALFVHSLQIGGSCSGHAKRHASLPCCARQHRVGAWPSQIAHAHGGNSPGLGQDLAQKADLKAGAFGIVQHAGQQA